MENNNSYYKMITDRIRELNKQTQTITIDKLLQLKEEGILYKNIPFNLTERKIDRYALVHVTNYAPTDNKIKTVTEKNITVRQQTPIGEIEFKNRRNTTHFTVNGTVSSHMFGNWDEKKYAVICPMAEFLEEHKDEIRSDLVVDFYINNSARITENSWILCPKDEYQEIKLKNPNANVISYEGNNVIEYTDKFLKLLAIDTKKIGENY